MGLEFQLYVGPFAECAGISAETVHKFRNVVACGRGEAGTGEQVRFLIPEEAANRGAVDSIYYGRQMLFRRGDGGEPPIDMDEETIADDVAVFGEQLDVTGFLAAAATEGASVELKWGVVPGMN